MLREHWSRVERTLFKPALSITRESQGIDEAKLDDLYSSICEEAFSGYGRILLQEKDSGVRLLSGIQQTPLQDSLEDVFLVRYLHLLTPQVSKFATMRDKIQQQTRDAIDKLVILLAHSLIDEALRYACLPPKGELIAAPMRCVRWVLVFESQQPDGGVWAGMTPLAIASAMVAIQSVTEEYVEEHVDALIADEEKLYEIEKATLAEQEQAKVNNRSKLKVDDKAAGVDDVDASGSSAKATNDGAEAKEAKEEGPTPREIDFEAQSRARGEAGVAMREAVGSSCQGRLEEALRALPAFAGSKHGSTIAHVICSIVRCSMELITTKPIQQVKTAGEMEGVMEEAPRDTCTMAPRLGCGGGIVDNAVVVQDDGPPPRGLSWEHSLVGSISCGYRMPPWVAHAEGAEGTRQPASVNASPYHAAYRLSTTANQPAGAFKLD